MGSPKFSQSLPRIGSPQDIKDGARRLAYNEDGSPRSLKRSELQGLGMYQRNLLINDTGGGGSRFLSVGSVLSRGSCGRSLQGTQTDDRGSFKNPLSDSYNSRIGTGPNKTLSSQLSAGKRQSRQDVFLRSSQRND